MQVENREGALGILDYINSALDATKEGNENAPIETGGDKKKSKILVTCPACNQEHDSAHVDEVNGKGTYQSEVKKQTTSTNTNKQ